MATLAAMAVIELVDRDPDAKGLDSGPNLDDDLYQELKPE